MIFGKKVNSKGLIYKLCQWTFCVFNEFNACKVNTTRCGFFAQGVVCGVVAFTLVPMTIASLVGSVMNLCGNSSAIDYMASNTEGVLAAIYVFSLIPTFIILFFGAVGAFVVVLGTPLVQLIGMGVTLRLNPWEDGFWSYIRDPHPFWGRAGGGYTRVMKPVVKFKNKYCGKVEVE